MEAIKFRAFRVVVELDLEGGLTRLTSYRLPLLPALAPLLPSYDRPSATKNDYGLHPSAAPVLPPGSYRYSCLALPVQQPLQSATLAVTYPSPFPYCLDVPTPPSSLPQLLA